MISSASPAPTSLGSSGATPDASNTGVPAGTALSASGSITVTTAGTVIADKLVTGCITVKASNVTIKDTKVVGGNGCGALIDTGDTSTGVYTGIMVEDVELDGQNSGVQRGIAYQGFTCLRCNIHGVMQGVVMNKDITVQDSYIHDPNYSTSTHKEAILSNGGSGFVIKHNNLDYNQSSTVSAALSLFGDFSPISNVSITGNLLNGGGYCLYAGSVAGKAYPVASNVVVTNNTFGQARNGRCGSYGAAIDWASGSGDEWSGNVWQGSGTAIAAP